MTTERKVKPRLDTPFLAPANTIALGGWPKTKMSDEQPSYNCPTCCWKCHPEMAAKMTVAGTMHCNFHEAMSDEKSCENCGHLVGWALPKPECDLFDDQDCVLNGHFHWKPRAEAEKHPDRTKYANYDEEEREPV